MSPKPKRFGIIRTLPDGIPQWIEVVEGLAEAKKHLILLASREPGEFFIYSEKSGTIVERFICLENGEQLDDNLKPVIHIQSQLPHYLS